MQISDNIKHVGLKMTPQRKMIYEVMLQLKHASIDDIITYLKEHGVDMTTSTVYRILNSFCEANLLTTVCHPATGTIRMKTKAATAEIPLNWKISLSR